MAYEWLYRDPPPNFLPALNKYASEGLTWDGITKLLEFPANDPQTGYPQLIAVDHTVKGYGITKTSSSSSPFPREILEKIAKIEPDPEKLYVVGNAMGATEKWGSNHNKDSFPRLGLINADPDTYGHKTFDGAHVRAHHKNRETDPSLGRVTFAFYDELMDKVLLLYFLLRKAAPHIVSRLENGESLSTSMGCRTPWDLCSICGNKAKNRSEYCPCLKGPGKLIFPDGRKAMAHTPYPRFFDQSHVAKGADDIAKTLQIVDHKEKKAWDNRPRHFFFDGIAKTASPVEEPSEKYVVKTAGLDDMLSAETLEDFLKKSTRKVTAEIIKRVQGMSEAAPMEKECPKVASFARDLLPILEAAEPDLSFDYLSKLAQDHSPQKILPAFTSAGIVLKDHEFHHLLSKFSMAPSERDVRLDIANSGVWSVKIGEDIMYARSCRPEYLYQRSLALFGSLTKEASQPQMDPHQLMHLLQVMQTLQTGEHRGSRNLVASGRQSYVPESVQQQVAHDALLQLYRSNLGRARPSAFDESPTPGDFLGHKTASTDEFIRACRRVPMLAYMKYAHSGAQPAGNTPWDIAVPASGYWLQKYVQEPRGDLEKMASVLAAEPGPLLDAATITNLRFVRDVLSGHLA